MCPANERCYNVMSSLIGWAHTQNYPCYINDKIKNQCILRNGHNGYGNRYHAIPIRSTLPEKMATINNCKISSYHTKTKITLNSVWSSDAYMRQKTIIGSDNGLLPGQCQAIIWTNDGILLIEPFGTNFSETLIENYIFSFKKMHLKL